MRTLGYVSKANPSLRFLKELRDHGQAAADTWLRTSLGHVGQRVDRRLAEAMDLALPRRNYGAVAQPAHNCARQGLEGKGVRDKSYPPAAPHPGHRQLLRQELRARSLPGYPCGNEIALGAIAETDHKLGEDDLAHGGNLRLIGDAHDVVVRALLGKAYAGGLAMGTQREARLVLRAERFDEPRPQEPRRAQFGDFHEEEPTKRPTMSVTQRW